MHPVLEQIRDFADEAHGEQRRKYTPDRYIVHPVRVMEICSSYTQALPVLAAALLHDVLEDTPVTEVLLLQYLRQVMEPGPAAETLRLVVALTDVFTKQKYPYWNRRQRKEKEVDRMSRISADAQTVKYADILDNCREIVDHDPQFAPRFLRECRLLLRAMRRGNPELYQQATTQVEAGLARLGKRPQGY